MPNFLRLPNRENNSRTYLIGFSRQINARYTWKHSAQGLTRINGRPPHFTLPRLQISLIFMSFLMAVKPGPCTAVSRTRPALCILLAIPWIQTLRESVPPLAFPYIPSPFLCYKRTTRFSQPQDHPAERPHFPDTPPSSCGHVYRFSQWEVSRSILCNFQGLSLRKQGLLKFFSVLLLDGCRP